MVSWVDSTQYLMILGITVLFKCPKLEEIDISILVAEAIRRIHNGESMSGIHSGISNFS